MHLELVEGIQSYNQLSVIRYSCWFSSSRLLSPRGRMASRRTASSYNPATQRKKNCGWGRAEKSGVVCMKRLLFSHESNQQKWTRKRDNCLVNSAISSGITRWLYSPRIGKQLLDLLALKLSPEKQPSFAVELWRGWFGFRWPESKGMSFIYNPTRSRC